MDDTDDAAEAAARLETALQRIADSAEQRMLASRQANDSATEAGARLDRLIAELRAALGGTAS